MKLNQFINSKVLLPMRHTVTPREECTQVISAICVQTLQTRVPPVANYKQRYACILSCTCADIGM
jgi:hypothetical protein